ncbi:hypothetical protein KAU55_01905 [Candidatus Bathyarchaeota archaeon]|nr:hypothetical protein [Candidatus Bathyarchaeota archaeon]
MRRKTFGILLFFILSLANAPTGRVEAWTYNDGTPEDTKYERFGPRADRLLIKLYENDTEEWEALARGEIDIADWPLSKLYYNLFTSNETNPTTGLPYNETINTVSYGSEPKLFILDLNNNPNQYIGYPPDPAYPNPAYPNPTSVKEMRQAIAYLVDRDQLDTIIGSGFYTPLYTVVPPYMGEYSHPEIKTGGLLENLTYPYSRATAEAILDAGGFPVNSSTGWRFWDRNNDSMEQPDEYLELKFVIRNDDAHTLTFGNFIADELNAVKVRVNRIYGDISVAIQVVIDKNFHLYIGAWGLRVDPDHLVLWHSSYYWHPGFCYNNAFVNDTELDEYVDGVVYANTLEEAKENAWAAQRRFAEIAASVTLWSYSGFKAINRHYTGGTAMQPVSPDDGENQYRGQYWRGIVNKAGYSIARALGYGIDNFWSFLNMHPNNCERSDEGNITARWGFKVSEIKMLNPVFAEYRWDWNILNLIYESLLRRNPYNMAEFIPWLAEDFEAGTYEHPVYGTCTKVKFTLRSDVTWHDGIPLTTADVYFTWVELDRILEARGIPSPWKMWVPGMSDFKILDPYNFEMLFDYESIWLLNLISSRVILPKHIWKPILETAPVDEITGFAPDSNMIGSGPWRFREHIEDSHVLLVANKPGSTVQTNLSGSTPTTSPEGYHRYHPVTVKARVDGSTKAKIDYYNESHTIDYEIQNLHNESITININVTYPNGTTHIETGVIIPAMENWTNSWIGDLQYMKTTSIAINITSPKEFEGIYSWSHLYYGTLITHRVYFGWIGYYELGPDIAGSTFYDDIGLPDYPYKSQLPTPDIKVDIKDIALVAKAFGSYPGHERWGRGIGDINNDYQIDIRDIAWFAKRYGWTG